MPQKSEKKIKIHWNGFLEHAKKEYPDEACAFLFSKKPYSSSEEWFVFKVKNASPTPENRWIPDRKEMLKVKARALKQGLVKIGNIHTHPCLVKEIDMPDDLHLPSETDLKFARRFNDVVRGIIVVMVDGISEPHFHDKFGNEINVGVIN